MQRHENATVLIRRLLFGLAPVVLLATASSAFGQVLYGTITGDVTDASGAVVVGAKAGFGAYKTTGVTVSPNQITRVNSQLSVTAGLQQVVVTDTSAALQTDKSDVNYEIAPVILSQIPTTSTEGRNCQALYKFVPGVTPPPNKTRPLASAGAFACEDWLGVYRIISM